MCVFVCVSYKWRSFLRYIRSIITMFLSSLRIIHQAATYCFCLVVSNCLFGSSCHGMSNGLYYLQWQYLSRKCYFEATHEGERNGDLILQTNDIISELVWLTFYYQDTVGRHLIVQAFTCVKPLSLHICQGECCKINSNWSITFFS